MTSPLNPRTPSAIVQVGHNIMNADADVREKFALLNAGTASGLQLLRTALGSPSPAYPTLA